MLTWMFISEFRSFSANWLRKPSKKVIYTKKISAKYLKSWHVLSPDALFKIVDLRILKILNISIEMNKIMIVSEMKY